MAKDQPKRSDEFHSQWRALATSLYIFEGNYSELKAILEHFENYSQPLSAFQDERRDAEPEISRRTYNFIASAISLIEHLTGFYERFFSTSNLFEEFKSKYQTEILNDPFWNFVKKLRNYCLHYQSPEFSTNMFWSEENPNLKITIRWPLSGLQDFARANKWENDSAEGGKLAYAYLEKLSADVNLLELATNYLRKLKQFYDWFEAQIPYSKVLTLLQSDERANEISQFEKTIQTLVYDKNAEFDDMQILKPVLPQIRLRLFNGIANPSKRCEVAITMLEEFNVPLSDSLKKKIAYLYEHRFKPHRLEAP